MLGSVVLYAVEPVEAVQLVVFGHLGQVYDGGEVLVCDGREVAFDMARQVVGNLIARGGAVDGNLDDEEVFGGRGDAVTSVGLGNLGKYRVEQVDRQRGTGSIKSHGTLEEEFPYIV